MSTPRRVSRGFTLVELLVSMAITVIIIAMSVRVLIGLDRDQLLRKQVADVQGRARLAAGALEQDLRQASLLAGTGVVWTTDAGAAVVARPTIQIFEDVPGTSANFDVKPGTDAVLVVAATAVARAATVGEITTSTGNVKVTATADFATGQPVLLGDYGDASWGVLNTVHSSSGPTDPAYVTLASTANVLPGNQVRRLGSGASVRTARARLYYVDTKDELVQLTLAVPRAPSVATDVIDRAVVAAGVENMQIDCGTDSGTSAFAACPAAQDPSSVLGTESAAMFGAFNAGQGPRLTATANGTLGTVSLLRTVTVTYQVRSLRPVDASQGDPKTTLDGATLPVGGGPDDQPYVRRVYTVTAGVRNTSLGVL